MRVLFVSPSFYPATYYGGPTSVNWSLCESLAQNAHIQLKVLTTDADGPYRRIDPSSINQTKHEFEVEYCTRNFQPDISLRLLARLPAMMRWADVVHLHGVFCFTTIPTLALAALLRKPVVWSASGALQRWPQKRRQRTKSIFVSFCDALCSRGRVVLHTASEAEKSESHQCLKKVGEAVIPFGVSAPPAIPKRLTRERSLRLLYLGRLHPLKGIENLLTAMTLIGADVTLAVCGEGQRSYEQFLNARVRELGLGDRVRFHGAVRDEAKEKHFRDADVCVVPSCKESFGAVVTESLARGLPVIASRGTPWSEIETVGCGLWVGNEPMELARAIDQAATMPLPEMGERGREWMRRDYSWETAATKFIDEYLKLLGHELEGVKIIADPKAA
jgi:glycosyltransferase involved in cell wall biosynthesis